MHRAFSWMLLLSAIACSHRGTGARRADSGARDGFTEPGYQTDASWDVSVTDSPPSLEAAGTDLALDASVVVDTGSLRDLAVTEAMPSSPDSTSCQPLAYSSLGPLMDPTYCLVDSALPECASSDVGASVYRDEICAAAVRKAHPGCPPYQREVHEEYVILTDPFRGCEWPITIDSVSDCGDHVDVKYSVTSPCNTCDGMSPVSVSLIIPNDPKPVRATATLVHEKC